MVKRKQFSMAAACLAVAGFAICGVALLTSSHAATPFANAEPEAGTAVAPASLVMDTAASSGRAVKFGTAVDASTLNNHYMLGYQGWFHCPGDGSQYSNWNHWFVNNNTAKPIVDQWPDTSELATADKCDTGWKLPNGTPAYVYSNYNPRPTALHMKWLRDYGVDGVMLQRFSSLLPQTTNADFDNRVAANVMAGSQTYGRTFDIMYDITSTPNGAPTRAGCSTRLVCVLEDDWKNVISDTLKLTASPSYQRHKGRPVVVIWGLGLADRPGSPAELKELTAWFHNNPNGAQYNATVMGGVDYNWRSQSADWQSAYLTYDIISRWSVADGKLTGPNDTTTFDGIAKLRTYNDAVYLKPYNIDYMPVIWPGVSSYNRDINEGGMATSNINTWPRWGGNTLWQQGYHQLNQLKAAGVKPMLYGAMYDEANEGTSRIKFTTGPATSPSGIKLLYTNMDGYTQLPSDQYLRVDSEIAKMLRGETPMSLTIPSSVAPH